MNQTVSLSETLGRGELIGGHRPWPRAVVTPEIWQELAIGLGKRVYTLLGLWGEPENVNLALFQEASGEIGVASLNCPDGGFPSLGHVCPPAQRLERALADLFGLQPLTGPDARPWLDHGRWPIRHPLGAAQTRSGPADPYPFLTAEGESLHQIPVGPVHAGIIEPGHFRFTANGETVVRLEERLGYVHKGIETLLRGATLDSAARLAGRVSGDSSVAYALAFARAVEAACGIAVPERALWLRALLAELERLANHFGDVGAVCNDAAFSLMQAHCAVLRERVLRASATCFGHRLLMDRIAPGGVTTDLPAEGQPLLHKLVVDLRRQFKPLIELYDNTASLQDRTVATGVLNSELARQFGAGGYVGRASGRNFDARRMPGYPPYDRLRFEVPVLSAGDVDARVWIRIHEVGQSLALIEEILDRLPSGPIRADLPPVCGPGEGMALVEGFRGDILVWLRLAADGAVERCHLRDPSWFQWPLLEAVIEGNIVADFPLCNKSFNCSYSGHDL
ncbi:MAG: NADH-quinone oxidoreductase subunit C [Gammaproteobacteria bacterium]|nr:NADH-quinone oxidoreductase subunit C [Gammaproteobacteria bacterium]MCP5425846.1 NADH-quinone oxidoreductase subunit C [Gammaproteobacteria bacterium]